MYLPLEYTNVKKKKEKKSDQSLGEELTLPVYGVKLQKHPKAHDVNFTVNFHILLYPSEQVQIYHTAMTTSKYLFTFNGALW